MYQQQKSGTKKRQLVYHVPSSLQLFGILSVIEQGEANAVSRLEALTKQVSLQMQGARREDLRRNFFLSL
jgi:hypothetical protein